MRRYRHARLLDLLRAHELPALLLFDPVNIRYATDARHMQVYALNHDARYCFVGADGHTVLFDWYDGDVHFGHLSTLDEVRIGTPYGFVANGGQHEGAALRAWAGEIADLLRRTSPDDLRLGIDRLSPFAAAALAREGVRVVDGQAAVYRARAVKCEEEIEAMRIAVAATDDGFRRMFAASQPGVTEVAIWARLHQANIEWDGEWINARYLVSGPRTNPWGQEAGARVVGRGDLVACDSDLIGPYGYACDISRSWLVDARPTERQRHLYSVSYEQVQENLALFRPGVEFRSLCETSFRLPQGLGEQMFNSYAHGIGLENEWPIIKSAHKASLPGGYGGGYDGVLEAGMTLCIESYVGEVGGPDGIKLEEQLLVTEQGPLALSTTPYELDWL